MDFCKIKFRRGVEFNFASELKNKKLEKMKKVVDKQKERWYYKPRC